MDAFALNVQFSPYWSKLGPQVHFIWKIIFISRVFQGALRAPQHKESHAKGTAVALSVQVAVSGWNVWMPGGRILAGKVEECHWESPSPATAGHKGLGLQQHSYQRLLCFSPTAFALGSGLLKVGGVSSVCQPQAVWKEVMLLDTANLFLLNSQHSVIYSVLQQQPKYSKSGKRL